LKTCEVRGVASVEFKGVADAVGFRHDMEIVAPGGSRRGRRRSTPIRLCLMRILAFVLILTTFARGAEPPAPATRSAPGGGGSRSIVSALEDSFVEAIARAEPSVVAIARVKSETGETTAVLGRTEPEPDADRTRALVEGDFRNRGFRNRRMQMLMRQGLALNDLDQDDLADNLQFDYGSGVVVGNEGQILTAYHVVKGARRLRVRAIGRRQFDAVIIAADPRSDLAVIVPFGDEPPKLKPIPLGNSTKLRKGSFLIALGNPYNAARDGAASAAWGILANIARRVEPPRVGAAPPQLHNYPIMLQLDAKLNLGMSGAPVVNLDGELVGLTTTAGDPEGFDPKAGYAIPMDRLGRRAVLSLIEGREVEYGFLGINLPTLRFQPDEFGGKTNIVADVTPGTPADLGNLLKGDEILQVGEIPVYDSDTLVVAVGSYPVGEPVALKIRRDDKIIHKTVFLSKYPTEGDIIATNRPEPWRGIRVDYTSTLAPSTFGAEVLQQMAKSLVAIVEVVPGSPADLAGLKKGRLVVKLGERKVNKPSDFYALTPKLKGDVPIETDSGIVVVREPKNVN
jgi:S1-C subfamily serine protease